MIPAELRFSQLTPEPRRYVDLHALPREDDALVLDLDGEKTVYRVEAVIQHVEVRTGGVLVKPTQTSYVEVWLTEALQ